MCPGPDSPIPAPAGPPRLIDGLSCDVAQSDEARLVYVRLGDALLHVREFRGRDAAARRRATCPACNAPVTIRLGELRVWHAAHRPGTGAGCAATAGESALHLNAKIALYNALIPLASDAPVGGVRVATRLDIALACAGAAGNGSPRADGAHAESCPVPAIRTWPVAWDYVVLEYEVGSQRPDLVLCRDGQPVGAIEVLVSHAVTAEKAAALARLGVPWLEVDARAVAAGGPGAWHRGRALPVRRASRELEGWRCPRHQAERMLAEARAAYRALRDHEGEHLAELRAHGLALRDMEEETARLVEAAARERARLSAEEHAIRSRLLELPRLIQEARGRLTTARHDLGLARQAAAERRASDAPEHERVAALERELRGLDEELARYDGVRRALSGLRPLGAARPPATEAGRRTLYWTVLDVYRARGPGGRPTATRGLFTVDLVRVDGKGPELWLTEDGGRRLHRVEADEAAESILHAAFDRRLAEWRAQRGAGVVLDRPTEWQRVPAGREVPTDWSDADGGPVPRAYRWDDDARRWTLRSAVTE